jgi:hypothetical protein
MGRRANKNGVTMAIQMFRLALVIVQTFQLKIKIAE